MAAVAAVAAGCPGGEERPLRIGVIVDCTGIYRSLEDAELSGAALPLLQRGADLRGRRAADGLTPARVAGRNVELVPGCTESFEFSTLTTELRRLVRAGARGRDRRGRRQRRRDRDARRGPPLPAGGLPPGRPRPARGDAAAPGAEPLPLQRPTTARASRGSPITRSTGSAGGAWRSSSANWDVGWSGRDAFTREFCALGGDVAEQLGVDSFDPAGGDVAQVPRDVDGIAVFATGFTRTGGLHAAARAAGRGSRPPDRRRPGAGRRPSRCCATPRVHSTESSAARTPSRRDCAPTCGRSHSAFPGVPAGVAGGEQVSGYRDAVEALLRGFERADGNPARLQQALAGLRIATARRAGAPRRQPAGRGHDVARADRRWLRARARAAAPHPRSRPVDRRRARAAATRRATGPPTAGAGSSRRHGPADQAPAAAIVHVKRVSPGRAARPPGRNPRRTSSVGTLGVRGERGASASEPLAPPALGESDHDDAGGPGGRDECGGGGVDDHRIRVHADGALERERRARQQPARVAAGRAGARPGKLQVALQRLREPCAELDGRPVVLGAGERHQHRTGLQRAVARPRPPRRTARPRAARSGGRPRAGPRARRRAAGRRPARSRAGPGRPPG